MNIEFKLSDPSRTLIDSYNAALDLRFEESFDSIIAWLTHEAVIPSTFSKQKQQEVEFTIAQLRAELLRDLLASLPKNKIIPLKQDKNHAHSSNWIKYLAIAIGGTLLAAFEGFDSITTMLAVVSLPSWAVLLAGLTFAVLSVIVFYGFDLVQVSSHLGVKSKDTPKLLDSYFVQMEEISALSESINSLNLLRLEKDELVQLNNTISMLKTRLDALIAESKPFKEALESNWIKAAKFVFSCIAGAMFFGGGFFVGQTVGIFILSLFLVGVTPVIWPVMLISLGAGIAALGVYWFVERVGLNKLISKWFGLDEEKIEKICDEETQTDQIGKLEALSEKLIDTIQLRSKDSEEVEPSKNTDAITTTVSDIKKSAANIGFFPPPAKEVSETFSAAIGAKP